MPAEPRRRANDEDRRRWPDAALDLLKEQVDDVGNELDGFKRLPEAVADLAGDVRHASADVRELKAAAIRAEEAEVRRVTALRHDLEQALKRIDDRFDRADADHRAVMESLGELRTSVATAAVAGAPPASPRQAPAARRIDWRTVLVIAGTITVPIIVALIGLAARG